MLAAIAGPIAVWWMLAAPPVVVSPVSRAPLPREPASFVAPESAGRDRSPELRSEETDGSGAGIAYRAGESLAYAYEQARSIVFEPTLFDGLAGEPTSQPLVFSVAAKGRLQVAVHAEEADGWMLGLRLERATLTLHAAAAGKPDRTADLAEEMRHEVLVSLERTGRVRDLISPAWMSAEARNFWVDLLASFQVEVPEGAVQGTWQARESDTTGEYLATYRRDLPKDPSEIVKAKTEYLRLHGHDAPPAKMAVEGSSRIRLERIVRSIHGRESLDIENAAGFIQSSAEFAFELIGATRGDRAGGREHQIAGLLRDGVRRTIGAGDRPVAEESLVPPIEAIAGILGELQALHARGGAGSAGEAQLMAAIADLVRRDPAVVPAILEALRSSASSGDLPAVLLGALGTAGTEAAQDGLAEVFGSQDWMESLRFTALTATALVEEPTPLLFDALRTLRSAGEALSPNALLLLGAMASHVRSSDPIRFGEIRDQILELAETHGRSSDLEERREILVLESAKNLRLETTPDFIEALYRAGDDLTRLEVVGYFEHTFDERANDLLFHALTQDASESIRAAAAARLPDPARSVSLEVIDGIVSADPSLEVRKTLVSALGPRAAEPPVAGLLATIAHTNDSVEVRELAAAVLDEAGRTAPR